MPRRCLGLLTFAVLIALLAGCGHRFGKPHAAGLQRPEEVLAFDRLYRQNCAACHGDAGRGGPALDLANPDYQALVDDTSLKRVITQGVSGTQMPAFGESAGGFLTERQVDSLVRGMRQCWMVRRLPADVPPYAMVSTGDAAHGETVFQDACLSCHSEARCRITGSTYLALLSDQELRTIVLAGRSDLDHPGWRQLAARGHKLSNQDVNDLVAYLNSMRVAAPGQPYPEPKAESPEAER